MQRLALTSSTTFAGRAARVLGVVGLTCAAALQAAPAHAAPVVSIDADGQSAVIDSTYSTTLKVSGRGFTSIKKGHGGIYVWFGTVNGKWKPSQGGTSGENYVYVPDSETKDNAGFQRYVAFPGSNTAAAANGGTMKADGTWSTQLVVPGPTFEAVGRNGKITTVDCRKVTCGVITIGAHGVRNGDNESFTPVKVADLQTTGEKPGAAVTPNAGGTTGTVTGPGGSTSKSGGTKNKSASVPTGPATLTVDHEAAVAGRAMSFQVTNLVQGEQFTVVLDDGAAAVGPFAAGADGRATGVVQLPSAIGAGTHELRLFGGTSEASVNFGVQEGGERAAAADESSEENATPAIIFAVAAGLVFLAALVFTALRRRGARRA